MAGYMPDVAGLKAYRICIRMSNRARCVDLLFSALGFGLSDPGASPHRDNVILYHVKEAVIYYESKNRLYLQEMARILVDNLFHILFFIVLFTLAKKNNKNTVF